MSATSTKNDEPTQTNILGADEDSFEEFSADGKKSTFPNF